MGRCIHRPISGHLTFRPPVEDERCPAPFVLLSRCPGSGAVYSTRSWPYPTVQDLHEIARYVLGASSQIGSVFGNEVLSCIARHRWH